MLLYGSPALLYLALIRPYATVKPPSRITSICQCNVWAFGGVAGKVSEGGKALLKSAQFFSPYHVWLLRLANWVVSLTE